MRTATAALSVAMATALILIGGVPMSSVDADWAEGAETASEVNGAVTGAAITIAVDENGNASGIVDIDTPVFGAPEGEIEIDGIKADAADL